jgi:hypothetical protein
LNTETIKVVRRSDVTSERMRNILTASAGLVAIVTYILNDPVDDAKALANATVNASDRPVAIARSQARALCWNVLRNGFGSVMIAAVSDMAMTLYSRLRSEQNTSDAPRYGTKPAAIWPNDNVPLKYKV